jgi:hypothetical protein
VAVRLEVVNKRMDATVSNEIEFSEKEVLVLLTSYYLACVVIAKLQNLTEIPLISSVDDYSIMMKMQPKLLQLSEKYGHLENIP